MKPATSPDVLASGHSIIRFYVNQCRSSSMFELTKIEGAASSLDF